MISTVMPSLLELCGGDFGALHQRAVSDDADVGAFGDDLRFAEGNGEVGAGIFGAIVGLAIKMLVLEKQHRIVAANGGAQQAGRHRARWKASPHAGPGNA